MKRTNYWVWLSLALGIANRAARIALERSLDPKALYEMDEKQLLQLELFSAADCRRMIAAKLSDAEAVVEYCRRRAYEVITPESLFYPRSLYCVDAPPLVLYAQGNTDFLKTLSDRPTITVVGTRNADSYGQTTAYNMSAALAGAGFTIVSGFALGIDSAAHRGALDKNGRTIAVLACGLDVNYPSENKALKENILKNNGVLLSELLPRTRVSRGYFHQRNRLLACLSQGVLVVQAPERSGAMITATCALEQGREIFAVPSRIDDPRGGGPLALIRDGAVPAITPIDVADSFMARFGQFIDTDALAGKVSAQERKKQQPTAAKYEERLPEQFTREYAATPNLETDEEWQKQKRKLLESRDRQLKRLAELEKLNPGSDWETLYSGIKAQERAKPPMEKRPAEQKKETEDRKQETAKSSSVIDEEKSSEIGKAITEAPTDTANNRDILSALSETQRRVYLQLGKKPLHISTIMERCKMSAGEVTEAIFDIGVPDPIKVYEGRMFGL